MVESITGIKETVLVLKSEYERLLRRDDWLQCMEVCGVDNWQGIDDVMEMFNNSDVNG